MRNASYTTVEEYIAAFPEEIRALLEAMRATIRAAAPDAGERISYQIPTFTLHGNLVHYAAFKRHIGFYPASSGIAAFQEELAGYKQSRGAVQFPLDQPLPLELVARITRYRADENRARAAKKRAHAPMK